VNLNEIIFPLLLTILAGLSTVIGSLLFFSRILSDSKFVGFFLGLSAGVMISISFMELLPMAIKDIGFLNANIYFFVGIILMAFIDFLIPHKYLEERISRKNKIVDSKMLSTAFMITIGLVIHNFPEGIAVFLSSYSDMRLGVILALTIAVHNIPEGIAIATPIYRATHSKAKAVKYAFIGGMAEPLGAIVAYLLLKPYFNQLILSYIFAVVAGVMTYISFDELLPACYRDEHGHNAILGIIIGMMTVSATLQILG